MIRFLIAALEFRKMLILPTSEDWPIILAIPIIYREQLEGTVHLDLGKSIDGVPFHRSPRAGCCQMKNLWNPWIQPFLS